MALLIRPASLPSPPRRASDDSVLHDLIRIQESAAERIPAGLEAAVHAITTADLRVRAGEPGEALADCKRAFATMPSLMTARYLREAALGCGDRDTWRGAAMYELAQAPDSRYRALLEIALGRDAEQRGEPARALAAYLRALELGPSLEAAIAAERVAIQQRRWSEAAACAASAAQSYVEPKLGAECWARAARHRLAAGAPEEARQCLERAIETDPSGPGLWLSRELLALGAPSALRALRAQQAEDGLLSVAEAALDAAVASLYSHGDAPAARSALEEGLEDATGPLRAFFLQELTHLSDPDGDREQWLVLMRERLEVEERPAVRAHVGYTLAQLTDDDEEALELLEQVLSDAPSHGPALELAVSLYMRAGDARRVLSLLRRDAETPGAPLERADALARVAEWLADGPGIEAEAAALLWEGLELLGGDLGMFSALERTLTRLEDWEGLRRCYQQAVRTEGDPARLHRLLTRVAELSMERLDDPETATAALEEAAAIDVTAPLAVDSLRRLAVVLEEEKDGERLEQVLRELSEKAPSQAEAASHRVRLARLLDRRGQTASAVELLRDQLATAPPTHPIHRLAHRMLADEGRHEELLASFDAAADRTRGAERGRWLHRSAELLRWRLGEPAQALERLVEASAIAPDDPVIGVAVAEGLARAGRWRELAARGPIDDSAASHLERGAILEGFGEPEEALHAYGEALSAGLTAARTPRLRLAAALDRWEVIEATYGEWETNDANVEIATRYAAAAIANERRGDVAAAIAHAETAAATAAGDLRVELLRLSLVPAEDEAELRERSLRTVAERATPALRDAALRELAASASHRSEELAGTLWLALAFQHPGDPVATTHAWLHLTAVSDETHKVELLGMMDERGASLLEPIRTVRLARAHQVCGATRLAADAHRAATRMEGRPLLSFVELPALVRQLEGDASYFEACDGLAQRLGGGATAACVLRMMADRHRYASDLETARVCLERAVIAHPTDYWALRALEETCAALGPPASAAAALVRAAETETEPRALATVAAHAARTLADAGNLRAARDLAERAVRAEPRYVPGLVMLAELCERSGERGRLYEVVRELASIGELGEELSATALRRAIQLALEDHDDLAEAERCAERLSALRPEDVSIDEVRLARARNDEDHAETARILNALVHREGVTESARVEYLMELAHIQAEKLDDAAAAIRALGHAQSTEAREQAADRLFELGERSARWSLVGDVLEAALSSSETDPSWEAALRRRLAVVHRGERGDSVAALAQLRRVMELTPGDVGTLRQVAELSDDPAELMNARRRLFAARPGDAPLLHALRASFLELGDEDSAFCAEAVAVGMKVATEEEAYFHQQRRGLLPGPEAHRAFEQLEVLGLGGSTIGAAGRLLNILEPALIGIFPPDARSGSFTTALDGPAARIAGEVAALFGAGEVVCLGVAPDVGPSVERQGQSTVLLLPPELHTAPRHQLRFVLGACIYRAVIGATWSDPLRTNPVQPRFVPHLLRAVLSILDEDEADALTIVARDMRRRMEPLVTDELRERGREARAALGDPSDADDAAEILRSISVAAGRAGLLAAQDPAAAIEAMRLWPGVVGEVDSEHGELPITCVEIIPFALSGSCASLRASAGLGLS